MSPKGNRPNPPEPPKPEPLREVHLTVFNPGVNLTAVLADDYGHYATGVWNGVQVIFELIPGMSYETGGHLSVKSDSKNDYFSNVLILPDLVSIELVSTAKPLGRLAINGQYFYKDNEPIFLLQCSDFNLFNRYQNGEDIRGILTQRRDVGFNCLRVWTLFNIDLIGNCSVCDYSKLGSFVNLCAEYKLYVEFTCYTDILDPNHWNNLIDALRNHPEVLLEYCNERHEPSGITPDPSPYHLCSRGSTLSGEKVALTPVFNYGNTHWNDASEWQRKSGHNSAEVAAGYNIPIHAGENTRFPDHDSSVFHAYDVAAGCKLFNAGYCFHSVSGKNSTLWQGTELTLASETVRGANSVDIRFRTGFYRDEPDGEYLRVYSKEVNNEKCFVSIRY